MLSLTLALDHQYSTTTTTQAVHLPVDASAANVTIGGVVAAFEAAIVQNGGRTRVLSISHVLTTNGLLAPISQLAAMAHAHNVSLVVDGAQAPGGLDVNVTALGCDACVYNECCE